MSNPENNPRRNWLEAMRDQRRALQQKLEAVELTQTDAVLAAEVRGLVSELRAMDATIENVEKFFETQ